MVLWAKYGWCAIDIPRLKTTCSMFWRNGGNSSGIFPPSRLTSLASVLSDKGDSFFFFFIEKLLYVLLNALQAAVLCGRSIPHQSMQGIKPFGNYNVETTYPNLPIHSAITSK